MTKGTSYTCWLILFLAVATVLSQQQQQQQPPANVNTLLTEIFNQTPGVNIPQATPQATPQSAPRASGFNRIVTPEPNTLANQQFESISGRQAQCTCIPYHQCVPQAPDGTPVDESEFDGFGLIDVRISNDDPVCPHFLDTCCANNNTRSMSLTPTPQETRPNRARGCGVRNVGGIDFNITVATDNEAGFGEFPWTVALLHASNHSYFCAGSLIHPRVVLTGMHCVVSRPTNTYLVRAGEWDTQTTKERLPYEERGVQRALLHPSFNPRNVANDFALLILDNPMPLGDHINTVCLPQQNAVPSPPARCISTGWGKDIFGAAGRFSVIMKSVQLPIVEFGNCQTQFRATRLGPRFVLDRSFICAGGEAGIDTCEGDGGAPLVCPIGLPSDNRYEQSGIVAWGISCNDALPAAYANVAAARNWIDEQMLANGFDTSSYSPN